jgi:hypothetical protein
MHYSFAYIYQLLDPVGLRRFHLLEDERIENGQDVLTVGQDAVDHVPIPGVAEGQALPTLENVRGDVDVLAQFLKGNATQKEAVKKRGLVSRLGQVVLAGEHRL